VVHIHFQQFLKAVILAAFTLFFIKLHASGDISMYINPKYDLMSIIAIWIFSFLFFIQLTRIWDNNRDQHTHCPPGCNHVHDSASLPRRFVNYAIILFPLVTGFALSPTVLDSSIAVNKGTLLPQSEDSYRNSNGDQSITESESNVIQDDQEGLTNNNIFSEEEYDEKMKMLEKSDLIELEEDIFAVYYETIQNNPKDFQGRKIKVSGFVYKEEGMGENQLVISRFLITHCIADASIIGLLTEFDKANNFKQDTWLEIEGTLDVTTYNGVELPVLKATKTTKIEEPAEPYVFPILTKVTQ